MMEPNPTQTFPTLTHEVAVAPGYIYPYSSDVQGNFAETPSLPSPESLAEETRGPDGMYRRPGFDFTESAMRTVGSVIEVGGPSPEGYITLRDGVLPDRPWFVDRADHHCYIQHPPEDGVPLPVDIIADVRDLDFPAHSVGVVLASRIDIIDVKPFNDRRRCGETTIEQGMAAKAVEVVRVAAVTESALAHANPAELPFRDSPRLATIVQAARILEPGGLFVMNAVNEQDAAVARLMGLEIVQHTPVEPAVGAKRGPTSMQEAVFRKPLAA